MNTKKQHTPEPWDNKTAHFIEAGSDLMLLGKLRQKPLVDCRILSEENYQRAVACVNACAGMTHPEEVIKSMRAVKVDDLSAEKIGMLKLERDHLQKQVNDSVVLVAQLKAQQQELVEALQKCRKYAPMFGMNHKIAEICDEAMCKHKGSFLQNEEQRAHADKIFNELKTTQHA